MTLKHKMISSCPGVCLSIIRLITKIGYIVNYLDFFVTRVTRPKFRAKFLQYLAAISSDEDELLANSFCEDIGNNCTFKFN
jgi:hypothetical protein